jgi:hypothetical protein
MKSIVAPFSRVASRLGRVPLKAGTPWSRLKAETRPLVVFGNACGKVKPAL